MTELQTQSTPSPEKQPPLSADIELSETVRSRVSGLKPVRMNAKEKKLFDESAELQNKIVAKLAKIPNERDPFILDNMLERDVVRVVEIAQMLNSNFEETYRESNPAGVKPFHASNGQPAFRLNMLSFESTPAGGKIENWVQAFNAMIDAIDPNNNRRFIS